MITRYLDLGIFGKSCLMGNWSHFDGPAEHFGPATPLHRTHDPAGWFYTMTVMTRMESKWPRWWNWGKHNHRHLKQSFSACVLCAVAQPILFRCWRRMRLITLRLTMGMNLMSLEDLLEGLFLGFSLDFLGCYGSWLHPTMTAPYGCFPYAVSPHVMWLHCQTSPAWKKNISCHLWGVHLRYLPSFTRASFCICILIIYYAITSHCISFIQSWSLPNSSKWCDVNHPQKPWRTWVI